MSQLKYLCLLLFCVHVVVVFAFFDLRTQWTNHGGDLFNRRYAYNEYKINPITAPYLKLKWKFFTGKDITATPAIDNDIIYFPCWNGNIYAINENDGSLVWKQNLGELTGLNTSLIIKNVKGIVARATPTIAHDLLIIGIYGPCVVIGLKLTTGELVWMTRLDNHPRALITMSGTYFRGAYYIGTSSLEEGVSIEDCCTFRGSFVSLNAQTGAIKWQTYMLPDNNGTKGGYAGAAIWGSSPSIDLYRNSVYIATGNLYSAPPNILECQERQNNNNQTTPIDNDACVEPENHSNSILALDLIIGYIKWYKQLGGYDVWFLACKDTSYPASNCPPLGPIQDADFGEAPMMLDALNIGNVPGNVIASFRRKELVVAVQKSGFAWALNRDDGTLVWSTVAGPSGSAGGGIFGAAADKRRIYTNIANSDRRNFELRPSNMNTTAGGWVSMNAYNGRILWSTANPGNSAAIGPVSVANDVVLVGSTDSLGHVYAIDARNGKILWSYATGATVYGGMSINNGCIYVGHGYNVSLGASSGFTSGNSLFAFCVL